MRILFSGITVATCAASVYFVFVAAWTNVLIAAIVFVLGLMGLEVVRIRESMSRPIEQVLQDYLAENPMSGIYTSDSEAAAGETKRKLRLHA